MIGRKKFKKKLNIQCEYWNKINIDLREEKSDEEKQETEEEENEKPRFNDYTYWK